MQNGSGTNIKFIYSALVSRMNVETSIYVLPDGIPKCHVLVITMRQFRARAFVLSVIKLASPTTRSFKSPEEATVHPTRTDEQNTPDLFSLDQLASGDYINLIY